MLENLTAVVPFRNGNATLKRLLDSLPPDMPVIVVDDVSDEAPRYIGSHRQVSFIRLPKRGYFAGAVNAGIAACSTDVLILNQDVWLEGDAWKDLLAQRSKYAVGGDGVMNHPAWQPHGYVQGTFLWITREAIESLGQVMDGENYPLWGCTALMQLRACRAGYEALPVSPVPGLYHARGDSAFGSAISAALDDEPEKRGLYVRTPPAVSVVIPCWNYGRYLSEAVASLLGGASSMGQRKPQTLQSFEIIIVNDGSTDSTHEVASALADDWKGVHYIRRAHRGGTAAANNAGMRAAHGRYVTHLSADDMMLPDRLEYLYRAAEANPGRVIYDDLTLFKEGRVSRVAPLEEYDFERLLVQNHVPAGILFERAAWEAVGGYPELMANGREDWAMNIRLGAAGYCGLRVPKAGYLYRREGQNRTLTNTGPEWREFFLGKMQQLFPELYAGVRPMTCCGGGRRAAKSKNGNGSGQVAFGVKAMSEQAPKNLVRIEYLGGSAGKQEWRGVVSGLRYLFGGQRHYGYVDSRDLTTGSHARPGLLEVLEGGRNVFRLASAVQAVKVVEPVAVAEISTEPVAEQFAEAEPVREAESISFDQVGAVEEVLGHLDESEKPKRKYAPRKRKDAD